MLKVSKDDIEFLRLHVKNVDRIINGDSVNALLDELYDVIMYKGFDKHQEFYNDFGKKAQEVYDRILYDNR